MNDASHLPDFVAPAGPGPKPVDPARLPRIDGQYVHKVEWRNVLIARIDEVEKEVDCFEGEVTPDWTHPFFFEHPLDHVPAMMLVEAARQFALAVAHIHLGVPRGVVFITNALSLEFVDFAEVTSAEPVVLRARLTDKSYRRGVLRTMSIDGRFRQGNRRLGGMEGTCAFYPRDLYIELRDWYGAKED